jgi:hypothetical protein
MRAQLEAERAAKEAALQQVAHAHVVGGVLDVHQCTDGKWRCCELLALPIESWAARLSRLPN